MTIRIHNRFLEVSLLSLGAIIHKLIVKDKDGHPVNIVCGYDDISCYENNTYYMGATIGRFAGRISKGEFKIDDKIYHLFETNGIHLHGGKKGFDAKEWKITNHQSDSVDFFLESPDGDEGYPGCLKIRIKITLKENQLHIVYKAETDAPTIVNLTNHSYFNLNGEGTILDHHLQLHSHTYLEFDESLLPTGKLLSVEGSPFDFREKTCISSKEDFCGIDGCFDLHSSKVVSLYSPQTGIKMSVETNQPAAVVYTPKVLENIDSLGRTHYDSYPAICFETQNYTNAPNHAHFPSALLQPKEIYVHKTVFTFDRVDN